MHLAEACPVFMQESAVSETGEVANCVDLLAFYCRIRGSDYRIHACSLSVLYICCTYVVGSACIFTQDPRVLHKNLLFPRPMEVANGTQLPAFTYRIRGSYGRIPALALYSPHLLYLTYGFRLCTSTRSADPTPAFSALSANGSSKWHRSSCI